MQPVRSISPRLAIALAAMCFQSICGRAIADDAVPQSDLLNSTLYMQQAVEYKATTLGIYALAKLRLDQALADQTWTALGDMEPATFSELPPAIILDCDETILDNSVYEASLIKRSTSFKPKDWDAYVKDKITLAIPGAVDFTQYAASRGVEVFYVTNRNKDQKEATAENMKALGFPFDERVNTLLTEGEQSDWKSAKGSRMQLIASSYRVLLLLGDNLGDFTDAYRGSPAERQQVFEANMAHWGKDWIALPNASYGSWESATFGSNYKLSPDQQRKMKIDALSAWGPKQ
jgi:acid phosphatase